MKQVKQVICIGACLTLSYIFTGCSDSGSSPDSPSGSWGAPELVETYNAGDADYPKVAVDGEGNATAVWEQRTYNGTTDILSNRYVPGTGWDIAELIETDDTGNAYNPDLAINNDGNAVAVWYQDDGAVYNINSNRYYPDSGWGTAGLIESDDDGDASSPAVAIDKDGNAMAVWSHYDSADTCFNILSNLNIFGDKWEPKFVESIESSTEDAYEPQAAFDNDGNAFAIWYQDDGAATGIFATRYVSGSGWEMPEVIDSEATDASDPHIAVDKDGNAVAVWHQDSNIWASYYESGTGWGTAELIETEGGGVYLPKVAFDGDGNAIAVWPQYAGSTYEIWSNRYVSGTGWGTAERIDSFDGLAWQQDIAVNEDGTAVAVWAQLEGSVYHIQANRYVPGDGWGTAVRIATSDDPSAFPSVAVDNDGNAIAVWREYNNMSRYNIWSCRYE